MRDADRLLFSTLCGARDIVKKPVDVEELLPLDQ
jgi:hypothetical protein